MIDHVRESSCVNFQLPVAAVMTRVAVAVIAKLQERITWAWVLGFHALGLRLQTLQIPKPTLFTFTVFNVHDLPTQSD